jgi:hypothetical protein
MEEILNNLFVGEVLYITNLGTQYILHEVLVDNSLRYNINQETKTLPIATIIAAFQAAENGIEINSQWYSNYNEQEARSRPCNLSVLKNLIQRIDL